MRDFFGELHCSCLSFDLVLHPISTPDARMEISGYLVRCVDCDESFHEAEQAPHQEQVADSAARDAEPPRN